MRNFVFRRQKEALGGAVFFFASLILLLGSSTVAQTKPNVVLIVVDDLGWADNDLPYANAFAQQRGDTDAFFETPHLNALAGDGTLFTQAYTSSPVCSPTRASLMLGQSVATHKVSQFIGGPQSPGFTYRGSLPNGPSTIAEVFDFNGYRTAYAGKWHLGFGSNPMDHGFEENYGGGGQGLPSTWFADSNGGFGWANGLPGDGPQFAGEYLTDRLTREAVGFIEREAAADRPFFLDLSHYGVHVPFAAPQELIDKYQAKIDSGDYAQFNDLTATQRSEVAVYAAMTESVDQSLGAVRQALQDQGVADDTVIAFISDNGGLATPDFGNFATDDMNAPLRNGKGTLYEGGVRTPLVIAGPGINAGAVSDTAVIAHDLYDTLLSVADIPTPTKTEGVDLSALLTDPNATIDRGRDEIVVHYPHTSNQGGRPSGSIYDEDWKLIQSYESGGIELFDLANDIGETQELSADDPTRTEALRTRLHRFLARADADLPDTVGDVFNLDTRYAGAALAITNASFEDQPVGDGLSGGDALPAARTPTGWSWIDGVVLEDGGVANPGELITATPILQFTGGDNGTGAMQGGQLLYFGSDTDVDGNDVSGQAVGVQQTLGTTITEDTSYTIRVASGLGFEQAVPLEGTVRLLAGDEVIGEFEVFNGIRNRVFDNQFLIDAVDIDPSLVGEQLTLQLLRGPNGGNALFDNVRVYASLLGDYDGDGIVAQGDLDLVLLNWGKSVEDAPVDWLSGLPASGVIGQDQLNVVLLNLGDRVDGLAAPGGGVVAVPEPAGALAMGLLLVATCRRRPINAAWR
ncbi:MAG: sulfatase-like hydrolase/transferase [Planctomycetota bacterium]